MSTLIDFVGKKFGRLLVKARAPSRGNCTFWLCLCDCGVVKEVWAGSLQSGNAKSCGCARNETLKRMFTTHGATANGKVTLEYTMWSHSRAVAKKNNLPHNLELSDIVIPMHCPVFGFELCRENKVKPQYNSPSLDKLIPSLGYVKRNVRVISFKANWLKQNSSLEELKKIAEWLEGELNAR
jgi:hypothetical protein